MILKNRKNMIKKAIKTIISIIFSLPVIYLCFINFKLYHSPNLATENGIPYDTEQLKHLRFLQQKMNQGAANEMQKLYPEGYVFMNALYGLAWAEFGEKIKDKNTDLYREAFGQVNYATLAVFSPTGTRIFPKEQRITHGAYYSGWSNYLLGKKIALNPENEAYDKVRFKSKCKEIAQVITTGSSPYVESYHNQIWPADITVAVASLALHDKMFEPRYQDTIRIWIDRVKNNLNHKNMIPHDHYKGGHPQVSRGSSMSLMLCFMKDIDPIFSDELFERYKREFLTYKFGLPGIREHYKGIDLGTDIDSGPVILSVGGSASIVGQKVMALHNEKTIAKRIRNSIEGFGLGWEGKRRKNYLFGQLAIADAFIAWVNATEIESIAKEEEPWRWKFQLLSLFVSFIFIGSTWWMWR